MVRMWVTSTAILISVQLQAGEVVEAWKRILELTEQINKTSATQGKAHKKLWALQKNIQAEFAKVLPKQTSKWSKTCSWTTGYDNSFCNFMLKEPKTKGATEKEYASGYFMFPTSRKRVRSSYKDKLFGYPVRWEDNKSIHLLCRGFEIRLYPRVYGIKSNINLEELLGQFNLKRLAAESGKLQKMIKQCRDMEQHQNTNQNVVPKLAKERLQLRKKIDKRFKRLLTKPSSTQQQAYQWAITFRADHAFIAVIKKNRRKVSAKIIHRSQVNNPDQIRYTKNFLGYPSFYPTKGPKVRVLCGEFELAIRVEEDRSLYDKKRLESLFKSVNLKRLSSMK